MKLRSRLWLRLCAVLVACLQFAYAQNPPPVEKVAIRHVGPPAASDDLIKANIRVKQGDPFNRLSVDDDVKNLYATGYFYNIQITEDAGPNGISITYVLQGKPVLTEIRFSGNKKYGNAKLLKKVTSKVGEPLNEQKLFNDTQEILKLYQKAGLQKTKVEPVPSINEALGKGTVTFEITEAKKVRVDDVIFDNATAFSQKKLRRQIKTRRWWMFSWLTGSGKLKDDQFDDDKEKLREFYADNGYVDFELKQPVRFDFPKTNHVIIHLEVVEGTQYKIGKVDFKGNELYSQEEIVRGLRTKDGEKIKRGLLEKEGEVFKPKKLDKDRESITDYYGARGYIDAHVVPQKNANIETGTIDLIHHVEEGEKSYIEKIEIKGNTKTRDKVIRRELAVTPGETFDMVRVKISKARLEQMNYFEKVDTNDEPSGVDPSRRNLVIGVEEKNTGNIALGAGFSSVDSLVGFIEVSQGNFDLFNPPYFTGGGQKIRLRAQYGTQRQDYTLTFIEPWFLGQRLAFSFDLYYRDLQFYSDNYNERQAGGRVGLRKQLPHNFETGVSYTLENIDIELSPAYVLQYPNSVIIQEQGERWVSHVDASLIHDTRNSVQVATRGHHLEARGELAGGPLGGDVSFYKLELRASQYFNFGNWIPSWQQALEGHSLELLGRIGVVEAYGDGDRGNEDHVPIFDRMFLGGLYSLRGYKFRTVGPREPVSLEPLGGGTYWFASAEYSIPVIPRVRFALFYDVGMVYFDSYSFSTTNPATGRDFRTGFFNDNVGIGLRLNLPIGPLRLDYAIPINHDDFNDGDGRFQIGVGYQRDF
jgi:outer membrane protein insertion porin family